LLAPIAVAAALAACSDLGDPIRDTPSDPDSLPELSELLPVRTVVGDTVRILGSGFGSAAGERRVVFTGPGPAGVEGTILSWNDDGVSVLVPAGTVVGGVAIVEGERRSNALLFEVASDLVSFVDDLRPIFSRQGCASCHGGTNDLFLDTPASILRGGNHGPAAIPRRGAESLLVRVLRGPADGINRMPFGSPQIPAADILLIEDWVNQGVRNN
jgi:hypothetical protein